MSEILFIDLVHFLLPFLIYQGSSCGWLIHQKKALEQIEIEETIKLIK